MHDNNVQKVGKAKDEHDNKLKTKKQGIWESYFKEKTDIMVQRLGVNVEMHGNIAQNTGIYEKCLLVRQLKW